MGAITVSLWRPRVLRDPLTTAIQFVPEGELLTTVQPETYTHTIERLGGYATCEVSIALRPGEIDWWVLHGLGAHLVAVDDSLVEAWEGFVDEVEIAAGAVRIVVGPLVDVGNRVKIIYTDTAHEVQDGLMVPVAGDITETPWAEDAMSQARYGVFEKNLQAGWLDDTPGVDEPTHLRDLFLQENAWPVSSLYVEGGNEPPRVTLRCQGYRARMDYLYNDLAPSTNLLVGGGFEQLYTGEDGSRTFEWWWEYQGDGPKGTVEVAGSEVVLTSGDEGHTVMSAYFWTLPGEEYTVRVVGHGDGEHALEVGLWDETHGADVLARTSTENTTADYATWSHTFEVPAGCELMSVRLYAPAPEGAQGYAESVRVFWTGHVDERNQLADGELQILSTDPDRTLEHWGEYLGGGTITMGLGDIVEGLFAARVTDPGDGNTSLTTAWYTTPGVVYTVSLWCHGDGDTAPEVGLWDEANAVYILERTSTGVTGRVYQEWSHTFEAPAGCTLISLRLWPAPGGEANFDDVRVSHGLDLVCMLHDKMARILDADRNGLFSAAGATITPNPLLVPSYEDQDAEAWTLLRDLVNEGDGQGRRYNLMVLDGRRVIYERAPEPYQYVVHARDMGARVETPDGVVVPPAQVRPGRWVLLGDLLGSVPLEENPERDPRLVFAETVTFTAPHQVAISGGRNDKVQARLAQLMLEGI